MQPADRLPRDPATAYAAAVVAGKIVTGPWVRLACQRHLRDLTEGPKRGLAWDVAAVKWAIGYFRDVLRLNAGEHEGRPFILSPHQCFIVGSLFGWQRADGPRRFKTAYIEMAKGNGKALAIDTPIPTPDGWTTMGELAPGDQVFDEHGAVCRVTAVSEVMTDRPCYWMRFSDGAEIVADAEHQWLTAALRSGGTMGPKAAHLPRCGDKSIHTTAEIARTLAMPASTSRHPQAKWNHRVDVAGAVQCPERDLPIPPYTLGAWLGDGDTDTARLTMAFADSAIADQIRGEGVTVDQRSRYGTTTGRFLLGSGGRTQAARNVSLSARLRALGLLGRKHIPAIYFRASVAQRSALLQGLLDTDGSALKDGSVELTLCDAGLAADALELLRSLGYKATATESAAKLNGREVGRRWRIKFTPYAGQPVFRLQRKLERLRPPPRTRPLSRGRMIVGCEPVPSVPVRCIAVDSPSRLFLAGKHMVPTHNSPLAAGIGMLMLTADDEARAEVYVGAAKKDQAMIAFRHAVAMWEQSPELKARLEPSGVDPIWNLAHLATGSFFRPISSERAQSGPLPHCGILDEIHEHENDTVVAMMRAGVKNRRQPLLIEITNSGYDRHSICWQHHEYSIQVLQGTLVDDEWFGYVCALDEKEDWRDEKVWLKANPNLGVSITLDYLRRQVREAEGMPAQQNTVRRLNFCEWTEQADRWLDLDVWGRNTGQLDPVALLGQRCFAGLDLASVLDLCAFVSVFPRPDDIFHVLAKFWVPEQNVRKRVEKDRVPYDLWIRQGWITATPGNVVDYNCIQADILDFAGKHRLRDVPYDRWNATQLVTNLQNEWGEKKDDEEGPRVVPFGQGFGSMAAPTKELEKLLLAGRIVHGGNPVLTWMARNVSVRQDPAGNLKPDKSTSTERIDGIVALIMAIGRAIVAPLPAPPPSVWVIG